MRFTDPAHLTVSGEFAQRLQRSIGHLQALNQAEMRRELLRPDDKWHWGADYMGRWLATMALLSQHTRQDYGSAAVARELVGFQRPDGSFGTYGAAHDYQEWFGMGRDLVGLLEYFAASGDTEALNAARRLGDFYAGHYPEAAPFMRECYASALEGLVRLAELTGDEQHWQAARGMAEASPVFQRVWYSTTVGARGRRAPCGGHVHCQLSTARGLLELYRHTGERPYLDAVLALHDFITREALWVSGGVGFYFNRPEENETCADADWLRLNLQLWKITGEAHYMDLAENVLVNQLYFAQADSGAFCYLRGLQNRGGATFDVCCSHHGPRAMWEVMRYLYTAEARRVWVNLLLDGAARLSLGEDGDTLSVVSQVRYETGAIVLSVNLNDPPPYPVALHVRVPRWAGRANLAVNGQLVVEADGPGYTAVERVWVSGDRLEVRYPRQIRIQRGHGLGQHVLRADEVAVFYGPDLYCLSDRWNPAVRLHLVHVALTETSAGDSFLAPASKRLEADGITPEGDQVRLVFSPLSEVGGVANGQGRSHPVSTAPFRVWVPAVAPVD